jgi:acyl-CoA thioester hydrolase
LYEKKVFAGWGDMDFNSHMRNTSYLDKSADIRMMFFAENGFPMREFVSLNLGPVIMRDEVEYFKEVGLLEGLTATLSLAGLADDGSRFVMRNEFFREDRTLTARVTSIGGWLDLSARRLVAPPGRLLDALRSLPRSDDFRIVPSSLGRSSG